MLVIDATNLPRLMACNGSRLMQGIPQQIPSDTTVRDEGNAAHYMAKAVFNREFNIEELIDRKAPNGVYMTDDMAQHVQWFLETITHRHYEQTSLIEAETSYGNDHWRVNSRADHAGLNVMDGADSTLYIDDFKYGWRTVEPENNWTLIWHAIGFCITRQVQPAQIVFTIHQPRPYHPEGKRRQWMMTYAELMARFGYIENVMNEPSDTLTSGPHCMSCPANAVCPAARAAEMNVLDMVEQTAFNDNMSDTELSFTVDQLRRAQQIIESRLNASEELIMHRLRSGAIIDNYSIETKQSNRQWKDGVSADTLLALTGKVLSKPKLLTPAQAKKAGVPETVVEALSERVPTGFKLVRISADKKAKRLLGAKDDD